MRAGGRIRTCRAEALLGQAFAAEELLEPPVAGGPGRGPLAAQRRGGRFGRGFARGRIQEITAELLVGGELAVIQLPRRIGRNRRRRQAQRGFVGDVKRRAGLMIDRIAARRRNGNDGRASIRRFDC